MGKYVIRQTVKGLRPRVVVFDGSQDDLNTLLSLMAGKLEVYEVKNTVGSEAPFPPALNTVVFQVRDDTGKYRTTIKIPHLKTTKNSKDIEAFVLGKFDANYLGSAKCSVVRIMNNFNEK